MNEDAERIRWWEFARRRQATARRRIMLSEILMWDEEHPVDDA